MIDKDDAVPTYKKLPKANPKTLSLGGRRPCNKVVAIYCNIYLLPGLAQVIMEAKKTYNMLSVSWITRKAGGVRQWNKE